MQMRNESPVVIKCFNVARSLSFSLFQMDQKSLPSWMVPFIGMFKQNWISYFLFENRIGNIVAHGNNWFGLPLIKHWVVLTVEFICLMICWKEPTIHRIEINSLAIVYRIWIIIRTRTIPTKHSSLTWFKTKKVSTECKYCLINFHSIPYRLICNLALVS